MRDLDQVRAFFAKDRFATETTGIIIEAVDQYYAKCCLKVEDKHLAANNQIMGGAIFTLADFAFAVAANDEDHFTVTATSNISYVNMAKDSFLIAECRCIKPGRKIAYFETRITDGLGTLVATVTTTGIPIQK